MTERQPAGSLRLNGLEATRGIAAAIVVFIHCSHILSNPKSAGRIAFGPLFSFGHAGVDFFFVLSGFVILHAHLKDLNRPDRLPKYFERRLTRIFPPYWAAFGILMALGVATGTLYPLTGVIRSALLIPYEGGPILTVAWSLQHELLYYFLFAVLVWHVPAGLTVLGAWAAAIVGANIFGLRFGLPIDTLVSIFNLNFFLGMGVALLVNRSRIRYWQFVLTAGVLVFVSMATVEVLGILDGHRTPARLIYATGATLIIAGIAEAERSGWLRVPSSALAIGTASYSIYLMHVPLIMVIDGVGRKLGLYQVLSAEPAFLVVAALTLVGSVLFSRWVEFPMLDWTRKVIGRFKSASSVGLAQKASAR